MDNCQGCEISAKDYEMISCSRDNLHIDGRINGCVSKYIQANKMYIVR